MILYKSQPIGLGLDTFLVALSLKVRKRDEKVFLLGYWEEKNPVNSYIYEHLKFSDRKVVQVRGQNAVQETREFQKCKKEHRAKRR